MAIFTERGRYANSTVDERGRRVFSTPKATERGQKVFGLSGGTTLTVSLSDSVTLSEIITKSPSKRLSDAITLSDTLSKSLTVTVVDAVSMGDTSSASQGGKSATLSDTITVTDAISKAVNVLKSDYITLADNTYKTATIGIYDVVITTDTLSHYLPGGPQLIGTITLKGNQQLNVYLVGNQALNVNLKGVIN